MPLGACEGCGDMIVILRAENEMLCRECAADSGVQISPLMVRDGPRGSCGGCRFLGMDGSGGQRWWTCEHDVLRDLGEGSAAPDRPVDCPGFRGRPPSRMTRLIRSTS